MMRGGYHIHYPGQRATYSGEETYHETVRDSVSPLIGPSKHALDDTNSEQLAPSPAEVEVSGNITPQSNWAYFSSIRDGDYLSVIISACQQCDLLAWKTPQGTPARISAASSASTFGAVKKMVVTAANQTKEAKQTFRYPYRSVAYPLTDGQQSPYVTQMRTDQSDQRFARPERR